MDKVRQWISPILTAIMLLAGAWVYLDSSTSESAVLVNKVEVLRGDVDELEHSLKNVPATLARIEERIEFLREAVRELRVDND